MLRFSLFRRKQIAAFEVYDYLMFELNVLECSKYWFSAEHFSQSSSRLLKMNMHKRKKKKTASKYGYNQFIITLKL